MKTVIINGKVITPYRILNGYGVVIEDKQISTLFQGAYSSPADLVIDAARNFVSPGFIDLHTHGGGGSDYMDGTAEAVMNAAKTHMRYGTTSLLPTTMSSSLEELYTALDCFKEAKNTMKDGPNLLGMHLEGPYVSPKRCGAQDVSCLREPKEEEIRELLDYSSDIKRVSAAPEIPGGMHLGTTLRERGILASIGHSDAMYNEILEACENGYTMVTHFYSGNSTLQRITAKRELGIIETAYLVDDLSVELISDGIHLPPELLRLILKEKQWDKITLTTDSMRGAGMPEGSIVKLGSLKHGQDTIIEGGVSMMMHRRSYGGSVCTTDRCVRTLVKKVGIPIEDAVRMISLNPARLAGEKRKGILAAGMDADICIFDDDINIKAVIVGGKATVNKLKMQEMKS